MILHAGDVVELGILDFFSDKEVKLVAGNMDSWTIKESAPTKQIIPIEGFKHIHVDFTGKRLFAAGADSTIIFKVKFQFFDTNFGGDDISEGVLSSSYELSGGGPGPPSTITKTAVTQYVKHEYKFESFPPGPTSFAQHNFVENFGRDLPKAKFMRIFVRIEFQEPVGNNDTIAGYKILIKGTLFKETTEVQQKILSERR